MKEDITPGKSKQSIDALNEKLYYRDAEFDNKQRRHIHGKKIDLEHDFDDSELEALLRKKPIIKLPKSLFKKFFFRAVLFFIGAITVAVISIMSSSSTVSKDLISMEILAQPLVDSGEPLELQIRIQNFNEQALELPDLILSYEKDSNINGNEVFLRRSLEDILPSGQATEEFNIILFGQEGDTRIINATLEYRIEGSSSIFVKEIPHEVVIRSTPTRLSIDAPNTLTQNQEITFTMNFASNSIIEVSNTLLKVEYPEGFEFISSTVEPDYSNNVWEITSLDEVGDSISIVGRLSALEGQGQSVKAFLGKQNPLLKKEFETIFNTTLHTVTIKKPFLETMLEINNNQQPIVAVRSGGEIQGEISFKNNLNEPLKDVAIVLHIDGTLYDPATVLSYSGFYDSNTNSITWNNSVVNDFVMIQPGQTGTLSFNLKVPNLIKDINRDPNLILSVDVSAVQNDGTVLSAKTISRTEVRANSDMQVLAGVTYHSGPFINSGPIPPQVGVETQYSINMDVINSSNDVSNTQLKTILPSYVRWLGAVSPSSERSNVSYNAATREIIWNISTLQKGVGVGTNPPKQVSVQVALLPSVSHIGTAPAMTTDIVLSGTDSFTEVDLSFTKRPITTRLVNDTSAVGEDGKVLP